MSIEQTEQWYQRYGEAVHRRCVRLLRDETLAWDTTQDVFLKAHRNAGTFRQDSSVLYWLLTIADRACFSVLRKKKLRTDRESTHLSPVESDGVVDLESVLVGSDLMTRLLSHFKEDVQQIAVLRFIDELEQEEIASRLNISRKTVYRKLQYFCDTAKKLLGPLEAPSPRRKLA
jgi:RNA polymerase sigma-70 factor (ECF subfamily)